MKKLRLHHPSYQLLEHSFQDWLITLNYATSTIRQYPVLVRELLYYLQQAGQTSIQAVTTGQVEAFFAQWQQRKNQTSGAGLSASYINTMANALTCFARYLKATHQHQLALQLKRAVAQGAKTILTQQEVKALYQACQLYHPLGLRDQAMLALYYGCGLRKNEGSQLEVTDLQINRALLHVRAAKGYRERYVPITLENLRILQDYLSVRDWFFYRHTSTKRQKIKKPQVDQGALLLSVHGRRMRDFTQRLRLLKQEAGIEQDFSLHTLRHSIATHLLQAGMSLSAIAQFLGHRSLESTQIYTHIVEQP